MKKKHTSFEKGGFFFSHALSFLYNYLRWGPGLNLLQKVTAGWYTMTICAPLQLQGQLPGCDILTFWIGIKKYFNPHPLTLYDPRSQKPQQSLPYQTFLPNSTWHENDLYPQKKVHDCLSHIHNVLCCEAVNNKKENSCPEYLFDVSCSTAAPSRQHSYWWRSVTLRPHEDVNIASLIELTFVSLISSPLTHLQGK